MNVAYCVQELGSNISAIEQAVAGASVEQSRWRPDAAEWSILEVIHHLLDEERFDFRPRMLHLMSGDPSPWPSIDPAGWVTLRRYNDQDFAQTVVKLRDARRDSLAWLRELTGSNGASAVDWSAAYGHGPLTGLRAGDLLASWAAHDLLHLRQLTALKYAYGQAQLAPYRTRYAGSW